MCFLNITLSRFAISQLYIWIYGSFVNTSGKPAMFSDNVTRASGIKRSLNYSSKVLVSLVLLLAFTPEAGNELL